MIAGEGPDVFQNWPPGIWELSAQGQVQNLNEYTRDLRKADLDDFIAYQWETVQIPTTSFRYGLPTYVDMDVLFYNKALFRQRGAREPTAARRQIAPARGQSASGSVPRTKPPTAGPTMKPMSHEIVETAM